MSRLSELARTVVSANVFTLDGVPVNTTSSGKTTARNNYVQVGDAQTLTGSFVTSSSSSFSADNSMFAVATTTDAAGTAVQFQVYYDTTPPTNTFSPGTTIAIPLPANILFTAVSSSGGLVAVVGNPYDSSIGVNNGSFYVFTRPSTSSKTWTLLAPPVRSSTLGQQLGSAVAISANGSVIAVGASGNNAGEGAVLVYSYNAATNTLTPQAQLVGTGATAPAGQGGAVQMSSDGNTIVSGGQNDNVGTGAVWTFSKSGATWAQVGSKVVPTGLQTTGAAAGQSLALSADGLTMAVGVNYNYLVVMNTGCVVMYNFVSGAWVQGQTIYPLAASGNATKANLGPVLLSAAGDTLSFGVVNNNNDHGATFIYNLAPSGLWVNNGVARIGTGETLATPANSSQVCGAMSPDGSLLLVSTYSLVLNNTDSTWFWIFA